ncbi:hypothetical protein EJ05DRAFT_124068 [Pseudovirgaria hyperparasitica]|uniref:Uncharacterized protein n=1 Tax=Pseudovirgaria hyperparasitica TaxID=470096 RepID=A0A6A6VZ43_9PEZI|nr:uncharacterized protein EJ05DRAFT_124068 [Pseudovirgaria hyperparasitica]KAF2755149.1 hypothetical protein EJ05DRAFT_124068 [Pseudovirgaria hyperparasitica]
MMPSIDLTSNDARVLTALFDPESSPNSTPKTDASLPPYPSIASSTLSTLRALEASAIRPLNVPHPSAHAIQTAISALTDIINQEPTYASAYANRAQARRLALCDPLFAHENATEVEALFADLDACITHASPASPISPVSPHQVRLLAAAHTHRGYLLMKAATAAQESALLVGPVRARTKDELEEQASREFFLGGRYGDRTAREMSVRTNPYAKMCGAIVKEAMKKEREEFMGLNQGMH